MKNIQTTLEKFTNTCKKYSLAGSFEPVGDLDKAFPSKLPRSTELDFFYKNYNPLGLKIETGFTPIKIYALADLEKSQAGYNYLHDHYLVIGDDVGGGKPIIAETCDKDTPIYANYDVGQPFKIADSFNDFIMSSIELIELVYGRYEIFDIADDNDEIKESFDNELSNAVSPILGSHNFSAFYDYFYG